MPALGDVRVAISVDKQRRIDYDHADTAGQHAKYISRYVECKSGASFSIDINIKKTMKFKSDLGSDAKTHNELMKQKMAALLREMDCISKEAKEFLDGIDLEVDEEHENTSSETLDRSEESDDDDEATVDEEEVSFEMDEVGSRWWPVIIPMAGPCSPFKEGDNGCVRFSETRKIP
ncbi:MAG: hypothetical protein Q9226_001488 [Calogaya cf. arnoldii]